MPASAVGSPRQRTRRCSWAALALLVDSRCCLCSDPAPSPADGALPLPGAVSRALSFSVLFVVIGSYCAWGWSGGRRTLPMKTWRIAMESVSETQVGFARAAIRYCAWWIGPAPGSRRRRGIAPVRLSPLGVAPARTQLRVGAGRCRPAIPARSCCAHPAHSRGLALPVWRCRAGGFVFRAALLGLISAPPARSRSAPRWRESRPWPPRLRPKSIPAPTCRARGPYSARKSAQSAAS